MRKAFVKEANDYLAEQARIAAEERELQEDDHSFIHMKKQGVIDNTQKQYFVGWIAISILVLVSILGAQSHTIHL